MRMVLHPTRHSREGGGESMTRSVNGTNTLIESNAEPNSPYKSLNLTDKNVCTTLHRGDLTPTEVTIPRSTECYKILPIRKIPGWAAAPGLLFRPDPTVAQLYDNEGNGTKWNKMEHFEENSR